MFVSSNWLKMVLITRLFSDQVFFSNITFPLSDFPTRLEIHLAFNFIRIFYKTIL